MSYRRTENEDGNYAKGFRVVRASLCSWILSRICTLGGNEYDERLETRR